MRIVPYVKPEGTTLSNEATKNNDPPRRNDDNLSAGDDLTNRRRTEAERLSELSHAALMREALAALDFDVDFSPAKLRSSTLGDYNQKKEALVDYSPLDRLSGRESKSKSMTAGELEECDLLMQLLRTEVLRRFGPCSYLEQGQAEGVSLERTQCDRACGTLVGLAVADALGHWVEFVECCDGSSEDHYYDPDPGCFINPLNRFDLKPGQWTDDFSMALCLADSLLYAAASFNEVSFGSGTSHYLSESPSTKQDKSSKDSPHTPFGSYDGSDLRARFSAWWKHGYCNAFRFDTERKHRSSCGLGGNISKSLSAISHCRSVREIPGVYAVPGGSEDAGNGSIMRLAPVAVRFFGKISDDRCDSDSETDDVYQVCCLFGCRCDSDSETDDVYQVCLDVAGAQSLATHPGPKARDCARFLAFVISRAIERDDIEVCKVGKVQISPGSCRTEPLKMHCPPMQQFLLETRVSFIKAVGKDCDREVLKMLDCKSDNPSEANWNWTNPKGELKVSESLKERGRLYNGYPVSPGYFGSFCVDGLALALHCCYWSVSFEDAIVTCINFLGDADSTGAVCGQAAGAFYGHQGVPPKYVRLKNQWDQGDTELRAALLAGCRFALP